MTTAGLERLLPFYTDVLGGELTYQFPPTGPPAYVSLRFGKASLGLGHDPEYRRTDGTPAIALWLYVDDCQAAVDAIRTGTGRVTEEPTEQPWGERVARAEDPDGNRLVLGQRGS
ncbi:VOC family protein [Kribbella amoyensis]|uniref:VOC family protein n=1 Tax=Kribbella amoyensis TaxID=996641 RepID=UPI001EE31D75|nr:VOC family protein [Kribbella amoyensis]